MTARHRPALAGLLAGLVLVAAPGCDGFLDINDDPNQPTQVPVSALLATTSFATGGNVFGLGGITTNYVQQLASPNRASASDVYERVSFDGTWGSLYDTMGDLTLLEAQAAEEGATDYVGIAKVLKALHLASAVDAWGERPVQRGVRPGRDAEPGLRQRRGPLRRGVPAPHGRDRGARNGRLDGRPGWRRLRLRRRHRPLDQDGVRAPRAVPQPPHEDGASTTRRPCSRRSTRRTTPKPRA